MFAANVISVEDSPNARSTCKECVQAILQDEARVRTEQRRYCHLQCYHPRYPVTINPTSDVFNKLQRPVNQLHFDEWLCKWNSQFQPVRPDSISAGCPPLSPGFSRLHIEVFKFMTYREVCELVGATCKQWRDLAWSEELWRSLAERDYPTEVLERGVSARQGYIRLYTQSCLSCNKLPAPGQIRVICPSSKRPICSVCFLKPSSSLFPVPDYCSLLGVSQAYIRDASVPIYSYNEKTWVFSHLADLKIVDYRIRRREEMLQSLADSRHSFSPEDLQKIKCLNLTRAKYIGVVLKHKFEGEEDLIDLLNYIYSASDSRGMSVDTLVKRNRKRRGKKTE